MKDPAILFYTQDFLVGTNTMLFEDRGKYITILCQMHQEGRLSEETIRFLVGSVSDKLKSKFQIDENGNWYNKRLEEEIEKRASFVDSRRNNGKKGGRPKANGKPNGYPLGKAKKNLLEDEDENENECLNLNETEILIWPNFEDFWNKYSKKIDRPKCELKWSKLKQDEKELIMEHLNAYIKSTPDVQFRKNPLTYLNNKSWENQIIDNNGTSKKQPQQDSEFRQALRNYNRQGNY